LPEAPDVVAIAVPPAAVPDAVADAARKGTAVGIVITAGLGHGPGSLAATAEKNARAAGMRLIGPNCLGVLVPGAKLNASFAAAAPPPGDLALISQSGAIAAGLVQWAAGRGVGFSAIVSIGDSLDVGFADRQLLEDNGWIVRDSRAVTGTPQAFQEYVARSRGEFSCVKSGYRVLETGWMTERTLNYLASGRPAIIQHTGRSRILPDAKGLFRFRTLDEAAAYLNEAERNGEFHSRAARAIVEEHFDSTKVLPRVLAMVMD
jgi:hypothetical protein